MSNRMSVALYSNPVSINDYFLFLVVHEVQLECLCIRADSIKQKSFSRVDITATLYIFYKCQKMSGSHLYLIIMT